MRTINANLTTEQKKTHARHTATLDIAGTDWSSDLVGFTHREASMQPAWTDIYLNNTDQTLTSSPPARGSYVDIARGCYVGATAYTAELPRVWIEEIRFIPGFVHLRCIDWWGRLRRWHCNSASQSWTATSLSTIVTWILQQVGMTNSGTYDTLSLDFTIPRGQSGDAALKRLVSKVSQYPYAGLNAAIGAKALSSSEAAVYTYGWNDEHPLLEAAYIQGLAEYNTITVEGELASGMSRLGLGSLADTAQVALAGTRAKYIVDNDLTTNTQCLDRATAELAYYLALASRADLASLPVHGLELYDVIELDSTPWGGSDLTARVTAITEYYWAGRVRQQLSLSHSPTAPGSLQPPGPINRFFPLPDYESVHGLGDVDQAFLELANLPEAVLFQAIQDAGAGSLNALQVVGAIVRDYASSSAYASAADLNTAFEANTGRAAEAGDAMLSYDTPSGGTYRLYIKRYSSDWIYFDGAGSLT